MVLLRGEVHNYLSGMNEVRRYLTLPTTEQLYSEGMTLFGKYAMVKHGHLYPKLALGPIPGNKDALLIALKDVQDTVGHAPPTPTVAEPTVVIPARKPTEAPPVTDDEIDLVVRLRQLRHKRMQASQQFHSCKDGQDGDAERADICDIIAGYSKEIKRVEGTLEYVRKNGKMPRVKTADVNIPDDYDELIKLRNSLSYRIFQDEKLLAKYYNYPDGHPMRKRIDKTNDRMIVNMEIRNRVKVKIRILRANNNTTHEEEE